MQWYYYFAGFWAGAFICNFIPHFVKGVCGDKFPTPFSNPRGVGLSSSTVNVVWALFNLLAGCFLYRLGKVSVQDTLSIAIFFAGFSAFSIFTSIRFQSKHKE
jgi:hypothetical protein